LKLHFVLDPEFCDELGAVEPKKRRQDALLQQIEHAAADRIKRNDATGGGFVVVSWGRNWLAWYETDGATVQLVSIRRDLR
jgi:hypothetical protein